MGGVMDHHKDNQEDKIFEELNELFKVEENYIVLKKANYSRHHLELIIIKLLLGKFNGSTKQVRNFLESYDKFVYDNAEVD